MTTLTEILKKSFLDKQDILTLLQTTGEDQLALFRKSREITDFQIGNKVYLRGLIEYSNVCAKDCLYCGIRKSNRKQARYVLSDEEVIACAQHALDNHYGSIVIQAGERSDAIFTSKITAILKEIKKMSNGTLGVTLSLGEQKLETYQEWFEAGAHRYLLRIESSNPKMFAKIHPHNELHSFERRLKALHDLRKAGFQLGTGVMIGLPFQTLDQMADDLLFLRNLKVDMVGMGPYIEHQDTPLYEASDFLLPRSERLDLAFKMIAILRLMMPEINIAAATALQAIDPMGREKAIKYGANIIMPNITPTVFRNQYKLYEDKPCTDESPVECTSCLEARISMIGSEIGYDEWGDSKYFLKQNQMKQPTASTL